MRFSCEVNRTMKPKNISLRCTFNLIQSRSSFSSSASQISNRTNSNHLTPNFLSNFISSTAAAVASSLLSTATTTTSSMTTTVTHDIQSNDKAEFRLPSPHSSSINMDIDPDSNPISDTVQRANGENENAEDANSDNDDDDDRYFGRNSGLFHFNKTNSFQFSSDAASVTSNLTRMCVSDDEEQSFETHRSAMLSDHI